MKVLVRVVLGLLLLPITVLILPLACVLFILKGIALGIVEFGETITLKKGETIEH